MKAILTDMLWLDEHRTLSIAELSELSGMAPAELHELMDYEIIVPVDPQAPQVFFHADCIVKAKTAYRLRHDFELDASGLALAMTLIERVQDLEAQLQYLGARLPRRII